MLEEGQLQGWEELVGVWEVPPDELDGSLVEGVGSRTVAGTGHMALALTGPWLNQGLVVVEEEGVEE